MATNLDQANSIRKGEELDWQTLEHYLRTQITELQGDMQVAQFHGGHANLTYLIRFGDTELVLRRPPFGKIAPGAHDMKREYRVLSKLYKHFPQAPRAYHYNEDEAIIGAKFVVIERRKGVVVRYKMLDCFKGFEHAERRLADALVTAQAQLHQVDIEAADLSKLGRPEGYMQRQLAGWGKRWHLSKTQENPVMDKVLEVLSADIPEPQAVAIIHNDYKFDNCQFQPDNPDLVTSIFDWDMTTLGDPLACFGGTLSYWQEPYFEGTRMPVLLKGNFPPKQYLVDKYQELTGFDMSRINWYQAFAYWKNAVILQQLYERYVKGDTKDERMAGLGVSAKALGEFALTLVS